MKKVKYHLSFSFLEASAHFANEASDYEKKREKVNDYYNYILPSGIISIVTFLEAYINEFYSEIVGNEIHMLNPVMVNYKSKIIDLCKKDNSQTKRLSTINKYDKFLETVEVNKLDKSNYPIQDVIALIKLRNSLIHYEPIWQNVYDNDKESNLKKLLNKRYNLCPYYDKNEEPFFPYLCLSSDCLNWAIKSSIALVNNFHNKLENFVPSIETFKRTLEKLKINTA